MANYEKSEMTRRKFVRLSAGLAASSVLSSQVLAQEGSDTPSAESKTKPPFRLGIVGSDNSHAEHFSKLVNLESGVNGLHLAGARVTHICGDDPAVTADRAEKASILNIVSGPQDMIGKVDGVLCVRRHAGRHLEDARPFLEAGIPVFVDKPFAASVEEAETLINLAETAKVGLASFSTLRFARTTQAFLRDLHANAGPLRAGVVTGPCELDSEYAGVFFYGVHTVELMLETFGYDCQSVRATRNGNNAAVVCRYPNDLIVTLNLLTDAKYVFHISAFGTKGWRDHAVDNSTAYYDGLSIALDTLKTGHWPLTRAQLLAPVKILAAIDQSLKDGGDVAIA